MELKGAVSIDGNSLTIENLAQVSQGRAPVSLSEEAVSRIEGSRATQRLGTCN